MTDETAEQLLECWFADALQSPEAAQARCKLWFGQDPAFDELLRQRFGDLPRRAQGGDFEAWSRQPRYALARIIALDQLPRNLYRGSAASFAFDAAALTFAQHAVARGYDDRLHPLEAVFMYLPFEHAEDVSMQLRSVELLERLQSRAPAAMTSLFAGFADYAHRHHAVVARFGRFPHRNAVLSRTSTAEEAAYLCEGGEHFGSRLRKSGSEA